jgi:hypothetical protein
MPRILYVGRDLKDPRIDAIRMQGIDCDPVVRYEDAVDRMTLATEEYGLVLIGSLKIAHHGSTTPATKRNYNTGFRLVELGREVGLPVIVNTGAPDLGVAAELVERGASHVLIKPVGLDLLLSTVMETLAA